MDLLYLLKENFKNSLFDLLITIPYLTYSSLEGASKICVIYQVVRYHKVEYSGERSNVLRGIESDLAHIKVLWSPCNMFYGLEAYGTQ